MKKLNQQKLMNVLDFCYAKALDGVPGSESVEKLAKDYLDEDGDLDQKIDRMIGWQVAKCAASGFVTGLGGALILPITVPADLFTNYYVLLRMIAAIAYMRGYDPKSDKVRALAYVCLCGNGASEILRGAGINFAQKLAMSAVQKISGETILQINQAVGFRLLTKFGETGVVNLGKAVPILGGVVGASFDGITCRVVGKVAKKVFKKSSRVGMKSAKDVQSVA